jgi:hypothetical protein
MNFNALMEKLFIYLQVGGEDAINQVADAEANAQLLIPVQSSSTHSSNATHHGINKPPFTNPVADISDEQPVTSLHISPTSAGSVPVSAEKPVEEIEEVKYTLGELIN